MNVQVGSRISSGALCLHKVIVTNILAIMWPLSCFFCLKARLRHTEQTETGEDKALHVVRGAATDSGPPGQHIHSGPPPFPGWGGVGGLGLYIL